MCEYYIIIFNKILYKPLFSNKNKKRVIAQVWTTLFCEMILSSLMADRIREVNNSGNCGRNPTMYR